MSQLSQFLGGGGGGTTQNKLDLTNPVSGTKVVYKESGTFTPAVACTAIVTCIGAGGGGFRISNLLNANTSGGGAGGVCQSELNLSAGVTYTLTVGAGAVPSQAGGNTTFTGSDITDMTANGGGAGKFTSSGVVSTAGGTATGGNIVNRTGGGSATIAGSGRAAGGGALGFYANGVDGTSGSNAGPGASVAVLPTDLIPQLDTTATGGTSFYSSASGDSGDGGFGCGGGANKISTSSTGAREGYAGDGGTGAGGGGAYHYKTSGSVSGNAGSGGDGLIVIQFI